jgi:hypothetical protein
VSAAGVGHRLGVFAVFVALALAAALPLVRGGGGAAAPVAGLEALEKSMREGARLHPPVKAPAAAGSAPFCAGCHHPLPAHAGRSVGEAMTNEHASRMDCLLCHWSAAAGPRPAPSWQVVSGASFLAVLPPERSSPEKLSALRSAVTVGRRCFERGPQCSGCHRPGGMAGLTRPGTDRLQAGALERLENYFTLATGEKWYFPQLK